MTVCLTALLLIVLRAGNWIVESAAILTVELLLFWGAPQRDWCHTTALLIVVRTGLVGRALPF